VNGMSARAFAYWYWFTPHDPVPVR
jgi:hypothetical protein